MNSDYLGDSGYVDHPSIPLVKIVLSGDNIGCGPWAKTLNAFSDYYNHCYETVGGWELVEFPAEPLVVPKPGTFCGNLLRKAISWKENGEYQVSAFRANTVLVQIHWMYENLEFEQKSFI